MRYISSMILFLACCLPFKSEAAPRKNVVDYFNMTVAAENAIVLKDGKWFLGTKEGIPVPVTVVDIKNGYILIEKKTEGWLEGALFLKKDGSPILVMSMKMLKGAPCSVENAVQVFELKDGKMIETNMIPILPMDPYFKEGFDFFDKKKIGDLANTVRISYRLPRKGTTIKVTLDLECFDWITGQGVPAPEEKEQVKKFLEGIKRKVIDINWDLDKGRFIVDDTGK